jgi:hypothetical protein
MRIPMYGGAIASENEKSRQAEDSDWVTALPIKSWHPSRMKTGLKNHSIGKKVTVVHLPSSAEPRQSA